MSDLVNSNASPQSVATNISLSDTIANEVSSAPLSSFSVKEGNYDLLLPDVLGHHDNTRGILHIETDRFDIDLNIERWESFGMYSMSSAGLDGYKLVGCVTVMDKKSGVIHEGRTTAITPSGELGFGPSGDVAYGPIMNAAKLNLERNKEVLLEALSVDLQGIGDEAIKAASWKREATFGGGSFAAELDGMKVEAQRSNFLWHSVTASREQGVFSNISVEMKGKPARERYEQIQDLFEE